MVLQPSYLPWRGYFHQIHLADVFVFYDDVQYDKSGWRNRNVLKGANGAHWITIPVRLPNGALRTEIRQALIDWRQPWSERHWKSIVSDYGRAPHFEFLRPWLRPFLETRPERLVDLTIPLTIACARALGIPHTEFARSSDLGVAGGRTERLAAICRAVGADRYVSGPSARSYLDESVMRAAGIEVAWLEYAYPDYPQLHGAFESAVSIVDLVANVGDDAPRFIWGD